MTATIPATVQPELGDAARVRTSQGERLQFLDALRGIAALLVVVEHSCELVWPAFGDWSLTHFRLGEFGVVVFFLCSGFIIPASLERRGSLRHFWIGRFFRLYPLYWFCLAMVLFLHFVVGHYGGLSSAYLQHWLRYSAVNVTMIQDFLGVPLALGQSWTLAYEMTFYLAISVLFIGGLHKRSVPLAVVGLTLSLAVGNPLRPSALRDAGPKTLILLAVGLVIVLSATWWYTRGRGPLQVVALVVAGGCVPLLLNRYEPLFQACFFLGTMFAGTAIYRWTRGEISSAVMVSLSGLVFVAIVVAQLHDWSPWLDSVPVTNGRFHLAEVLTYGGAYVLFGLAVTFRHRNFPRALIYLGTISYSLYLVHALVIYGIGAIGGHRVLTAICWIGGSVVASSLTYRFIERPAIGLGRRLGGGRRRSLAGSLSAR